MGENVYSIKHICVFSGGICVFEMTFRSIRQFQKRLHRNLLWLALGILIFMPVHAWGGNSAVIFMYHRFGENDFPSTNVKLEKFEQHIEELNKEKEAELKKLVDEGYNDPEKLAKQIANTFGLEDG